MTQNQWILATLQQKPLTPLEALEGCGCFRLAARIKELKEQGHKITTRSMITPTGKIIASYVLEQGDQNETI